MITTIASEITPYPYQDECQNAIAEADAQGKKTALVVMASGLGKTIVVAQETKRRLGQNSTVRCLYLCHQNDILEQSLLIFQAILGTKISYGFFAGEERSTEKSQIVFGSFQSMRGNLNSFDKDEFDLIIVDETHHSWAPSYEKVIRYFTPKFLLGITATPDRFDKMDIREIYGQEVYNLPLVNALAEGLLCPVEYKLLSDDIASHKHLLTKKGRLSIKFLNRKMFSPRRDTEIVAIIKRHIEEIENACTIIFCPSIEHAELIADMMPHSVALHSQISKAERKVRLELFRSGVFKVAVCVDMFNEALDIPEANLIVFLRMTSSPIVYYQQLGRGLRPYPGKEKVTILDFVGNCERVLTIYELWAKVKKEKERLQSNSVKTRNGKTPHNRSVIDPFVLDIESVDFREKIFPLIETIRRIKEQFYSTWLEASEVVIKMGIKSVLEYNEMYRMDFRLPSGPSHFYIDFPGWYRFLGKSPKDFYPTWQEASESVRRLGIKSMRAYGRDKMRKLDSKLPVLPQTYYPDFPGWYQFLGKSPIDFYPTWEEASAILINLGVKSSEDYQKRWKELKKLDPKLHNRPAKFYKDFPGWSTFLNRPDFYKTPEEALGAINELGIKSRSEYIEKCHIDPRLPKNLVSYYELSSWKDIFPAMIKKYRTWQEASAAVKRLGITTVEEYQGKYKEDPMLPAAFITFYPDYPGWSKFIGE